MLLLVLLSYFFGVDAVDCDSKEASECLRRCSPCVANPDSGKDADGKSCTTCGICFQYAQCAGKSGTDNTEKGSDKASDPDGARNICIFIIIS